MPKPKSVFICQQCSHKSFHWVGQCPQCGAWNSFEETVVAPRKSFGGAVNIKAGPTTKPIQLTTVATQKTAKISSGIGEFDRVLGGGFVPGQVIILAGEPGVGKSTLITQIAKSMGEKKVLYVCGEESPEQIKLRVTRMGYSADNLYMLPDTDVDSVIASVEAQQEARSSGVPQPPALLIIDSIQTLTTQELTGVPGSVGQVRLSTQKITSTAKRLGIPTVLIGHVTKEGAVAGPKVLEHIVDTVLQLEGDSQHLFRILKTTKNRFGAVSEVGIFEITDVGIQEVKNPSEFFLNQAPVKNASGSCTTVVVEGFRPLLFEIQVLTTRTPFGYPKRTATGFSANRLAVLIAILEKRCGLNLADLDVYLSVAGGFKIVDYACDLAVCLAIASSVKNKPIGGRQSLGKGGTSSGSGPSSQKIAAFGECGLLGEVRRVSHQERRIKEAKALGFSNVISASNVKLVKEAIDKVLG